MKPFEYVVACVYFYGMIHEDRIIHIYNKHHPKEKISTLKHLDYTELEKKYVYYDSGFYVHQALYWPKEMKEHLNLVNGKPYYLPCEEELSKHLDSEYIEKNEYYQALYDYTLDEIVDGDKEIAEDIMFEIVISCEIGEELTKHIFTYTRRDLDLDENQMKNLLSLIADLHNHTKTWINNGFSPIELRELEEIPNKIGRNDPCPCGSGKKYKHCCLRLGYINYDFGPLHYENVFEATQEEMAQFEASLMKASIPIQEEVSHLKEPSLEDMISDASNFGCDELKDCYPKDIVAAIVTSLLVFHGKIKDIEKDMESIWRKLRVWSRRHEIMSLRRLVDRIIFDEEPYDSSDSEVLRKLSGVYEEYNQYPRSSDSLIRICSHLRKQLGKAPYDESENNQLEELAFQVFKSTINDPELHLMNLLRISPYLPFAISALIPHTEDEFTKMELLDNYILAFETTRKIQLDNPRKQFTHYGDNKEYILALDTLGYFHKVHGHYDKALPYYEKILKYDDEDRFGAKESILICYALTRQMETYEKAINALPEDSFYRVFLKLFEKIIMDEPWHREYLVAYKKSKKVLDIICGVLDISETDLELEEKFFLEDFHTLFKSGPGVIDSLKSMHVED